MFHFSTSTTTTTEFVDNSEDPGLFDSIEFRIGKGSWVLLLLVIPLCIILVICGIWYYGRLARWYMPEGSDVLDENTDKYGVFRIVRNQRNGGEKPIKGQLVIIMVEDLPNLRPLGLELVETKVMRVHPRGQRFGWHVGDVIREIAGHEVHSFEEIWQRIQIERDRCPVKFVAERFDWSKEAARATTPPEMQAIKALQRGSRAKIGPLPEPNLTGALGDTNVPTSAVAGWDTWAVTKGPEQPAIESPVNASDDLQKALKAAGTTREQDVAARMNAAARRREGADEARKAWQEDSPREKDQQAMQSDLGTLNTADELKQLNTTAQRARTPFLPGETQNNTLDLRATASADRKTSKLSVASKATSVGSQLKAIAGLDRQLTVEEEKAVADRVARTFHHTRHRPQAKAPKEEVRWVKDGWGRQVQTYV
jgi:hypothetical protein